MMVWPWSRTVTTATGRCLADRPETYFQVHISVEWRRRRGQKTQAVELGEKIIKTAEWVCGKISILDAPRATQVLDGELRDALSAEVRILNIMVRIVSEQHSVDFVMRLEERVRRKLELEHLRDLILKDPTLAALWYLNGDRSRLFELADKSTQFERAISAVTGSLTTDDRTRIVDLVKYARENAKPQLWNLVLLQISDLLGELGQAHLEEGVRSFMDDVSTDVSK
ncbi:hypothetical protein [Actinomadura craniellae]|uniref:hypothetical protein n=1 Tax=Actinomadura craniellae TaxID=2231787 RepID=UPI0011BD9FFC|nr:hypothetical protein [Actinomadura craniellae]